MTPGNQRSATGAHFDTKHAKDAKHTKARFARGQSLRVSPVGAPRAPLAFLATLVVFVFPPR